MIGEPGGDEGVDDGFMVRGDAGIDATIMGRNMFSPIRGGWGGMEWNGWWGDEPPYHRPVFVLTHHPRPSLAMRGGTVFHFVTDGIGAAPSSTTSPTASGRPWNAPPKRPAGRTSGSAAEPPPSSSTCAPAWSTNCTS